MKLMTHKTLLLVLIAFAMAISAGPTTAEVYKTVDEDGNVTYTDQPPKDGSKPMELAPISVIEAPTYEKATDSDNKGTDGEAGKEMSLRDLRKQYRDFAIVSPQSEESVWHPEQDTTIAWNVGNQLLDGMQVTISVNGKTQPSTTERSIPVPGLDRGEHTITAVLKDAGNRTIATAEPVTFFVRRPNIYSNRPRPTPRGG